jgi:hypothetical protein
MRLVGLHRASSLILVAFFRVGTNQIKPGPTVHTRLSIVVGVGVLTTTVAPSSSDRTAALQCPSIRTRSAWYSSSRTPRALAMVVLHHEPIHFTAVIVGIKSGTEISPARQPAATALALTMTSFPVSQIAGILP